MPIRLASYPRQNGLATALRKFGRIESTLFMLGWLRDPAMCRQIQASLKINEQPLSHLSLLDFEHINMTGEYNWKSDRIPASGQFRRLRPAKVER